MTRRPSASGPEESDTGGPDTPASGLGQEYALLRCRTFLRTCLLPRLLPVCYQDLLPVFLLQTLIILVLRERVMGIEPTTATLAICRTTRCRYPETVLLAYLTKNPGRLQAQLSTCEKLRGFPVSTVGNPRSRP
jgi:hypothetical protein